MTHKVIDEISEEDLAFMAKVLDVMTREGVTLDCAIEYCKLTEEAPPEKERK